MKHNTAVRSAIIICMFVGLSPRHAGADTILDALNGASTTTQFALPGSGGVSVSANGFVGPRFTLSESMVITEVGGFIDRYSAATVPLTVQIRPATNGTPDASVILGSFSLSDDQNSSVISYESTAPNLTLPPGTYYALFAGSVGDDAMIMNSASDPYRYLSGLVTEGCVGLSCGNNPPSKQYEAVRILGIRSMTPTLRLSWGRIKTHYR